ncbi:MAG TPA: zinc-ribbon and DUF3426 domain-containing protein [Rhodanobacteraceae bacterium]|nr:zinc-ribbon and DUF3426 domain-containing protein [Rhodanobacteraceae bacterium]
MYTQCPECLTIFRLTGADLAATIGSVRCGHCNAVFDALRTLTEQLPPEPIGNLEPHPTQVAPPQLGLPVFRPSPNQGALLFDPDDRPRAQERPVTPAFTRRHRARPRRNGTWIAGSVVLTLALGGQIAWAERALWLDDARVRGILDPACARVGCTLPPRHDVGELELLSRDIRPHPSVPGALIISATVRNDAAFAQAFPTVEITLSDLDETRIAMRRFQPRDYVSDPRTIATGLAPGASTALVFEVADPGKNAVAFEFKFGD